MFDIKYLLYLIIFESIVGIPQMNLYYTDQVSKNDNVFQHDCLRVIPNTNLENDPVQIIYYCINELLSTFDVETNNLFPKLTFNDLSKENITSEELYLWSTPIDIIERYQFYLNQLLTENNISLGKEIFYNCTIPRFGPKCEYEFNSNYRDYSSLYEMLVDFYVNNRYDSISLTCYTHLKCNRGPYPLCLDWSEICNGQIDCLDGGFDEEHCWQLEINECQENEYRCNNGQCIPKLFYRDTLKIPDCMDGSDEFNMYGRSRQLCYVLNELPFRCESITCKRTPLTNSCEEKRADLLMQTMYSIENNSISKDCWTAFKCLIHFPDSEYLFCNNICKQNACIEIVNKTCPDVLYFPTVPVLFGNIYFMYKKTDFQYLTNSSNVSFNICYNTSDYDHYFVNVSTMLINNMICIPSEPLLSRLVRPTIPSQVLDSLYHDNIFKLYGSLKRYHLIYNYTSVICKKWNMYQCIHSLKCISIYRLMDTIYDCPNMDDEDINIINNINLIEHFKNNYFKCEESGKYIPRSLIKNDFCDCINVKSGWCEDEDLEVNYIKKNILFQHICDGFIDLIPIIIEERNETDETECEEWQCNNIYTRCNNVWNCPNGKDETGCGSLLTLNCSFNYHLCVSPQTNQFMCLPIEKANDGNVDCLGATDEPKLCGTNTQSNLYKSSYDFYCMNGSFKSCLSMSNLCDDSKQCEHGDDEQFCTTNRTSHKDSGVCLGYNYLESSSVEKFLCDYRVPSRLWEMKHFTLDGINYFLEDQSKNMKNSIVSSSSIIKMSNQHQSHCHHGLSLRVWLNNKNNLRKSICLCSSNFYGSQCQYQNERINLIIKFQALSDSWQTLFAIVILLIDDSDERIIHSYEQFTYLSMRDCQHKFSIYLFYSSRPKNLTKTYSIHIDIYEKVSLDYRGSLLLPVHFSFLPFQRLAFLIDIPRSDNNDQNCLNDQCIHGKCIKYSNKLENETFCQCNEGWSGRYCTIEYISTCSSDSLSIGVSVTNRSICVCPINKFGSRCFLVDRICQNNNKNNLTCQNGGQCIPNDDYLIFDQQFLCICPKGFNGQLCEFADNQLILSFEKDIILSQEMFIHFFDISVTIKPNEAVVRSTSFHPITPKQDSVIIYWSQPFNIVFIELFNKNYYLIVVENNYNQSSTIIKKLNSSDRCPHINELFNKRFIELHLIRRIKSYHLPCQNRSLNLSCFYDDIHLCLCYDFGKERLANCLNFDHNMTFDCLGQSECENDGQCLEDTPHCPHKSICICSSCFYGRRCQFSTNVFGLSLDAIIGYHILPDVHLSHQPFIIKISLVLTIIFTVLGIINGIFSIITFKNKIVREVGCGFYLMGSSISTLLTMIMFGFKFGILVLAQMTIISSRSFLLFQCYSIDFILRICLSMDQWLNACVAIERAITSIKGTHFNKRKSRNVAKFVIIILLILIIATSIHDPIYRRLIDERNDDNHIKRIWCIVSYRWKLQVYNSVMQIFHFFVPFIMNFISVIILIRKQIHQQASIHPQRTYQEVFRTQFNQHKQLLTGPIVLVILALPRLIISFLSKCMKSTNDSWLFLFGYFISFIPPMITFLVFIIPSKFYKKLFCKSIQKYRIIIQRYLQLLS